MQLLILLVLLVNYYYCYPLLNNFSTSEFDFLVKFQGDKDNYWIPYEELKYSSHLKNYIALNSSKFKDVKF